MVPAVDEEIRLVAKPLQWRARPQFNVRAPQSAVTTYRLTQSVCGVAPETATISALASWDISERVVDPSTVRRH